MRNPSSFSETFRQGVEVKLFYYLTGRNVVVVVKEQMCISFDLNCILYKKVVVVIVVKEQMRWVTIWKGEAKKGRSKEKQRREEALKQRITCADLREGENSLAYYEAAALVILMLEALEGLLLDANASSSSCYRGRRVVWVYDMDGAEKTTSWINFVQTSILNPVGHQRAVGTMVPGAALGRANHDLILRNNVGRGIKP
ncbi:hypothetical protein RIF29_38948 [Crotalaria pallida]|uniref:Uncharacterized protein n=1 Tax=Crotalaria pallida TaxID=3830 RepID=A0AAN9E0Y1_CROPI